MEDDPLESVLEAEAEGRIAIPQAKVVYKYRRVTDPEFAGAFLNLFVVKILITCLLLLLNNAYRPNPMDTHPEECPTVDTKCSYNHTLCPYGKAKVMVPNNTSFVLLGKCKKPCTDGFQCMGFQSLCMEIGDSPNATQELMNCSDIGDALNNGPKYESFTLTVMQISLDHRIFFAKVLATVFTIATAWGLLLRFFPATTLVLTIVLECAGGTVTGIFLYLQTQRQSALYLFLGAVGVVLLASILLRRFLKRTIKYLKCADQCMTGIPEAFGTCFCLQLTHYLLTSTVWAFLIQLIALAYGVAYVYIIRQSFEILGAENDGTECKLRPPFLIMMAWAFAGMVYMWAVLSLRQLTRGMTSGAVALYYFHNEDFDVRILTAEAHASMRWATTTSIGSYFLMGCALPIVEFVRIFQRRSGKMLLLRILLCGCGKSFAELVRILDSHATALHAVSSLDITRSAAAFHHLLHEKRMQQYLELGSNTRKVFHCLSALAGFSTGVVVFIYLLYQYGVLEAVKASDKSLLSVSGFGVSAIIFMLLSSYFPKAAILAIGFDSAARYGENHGTVGMFTVAMIAAALTSVLTGYLSDVIVQALETLLVCRCLEIHDESKPTPTETLFKEVLQLESSAKGFSLRKKKYKVAVDASEPPQSSTIEATDDLRPDSTG